MAAHAGADFVAVPVSSRDLAEAFLPTVLAGEGLVYNGHAPARWLLSRALSQSGFKCALGGEGADELFAGYAFAEMALRASSRRRPLDLWRRLLSGFPPPYDQLRQISPSLGWLVRGLGFPEDLAGFLVGQLMTIRRLARTELLSSDPYRAWLGSVPWRRLLGREAVKALLYLWTRSAFVNYVLAAERLDMAHGVELRLPFLDHRLFEYTRKLPASLLFSGQENKALLRQVAAPYVTPQVRRGAKQPFIAPPSQPLRKMLREVILGAPDLPFFQRKAVLELLEDDDETNEPLLCLIASFAILHRELRL
jgi:asparagine synthase (glutamine-hydrolysing)